MAHDMNELVTICNDLDAIYPPGSLELYEIAVKIQAMRINDEKNQTNFGDSDVVDVTNWLKAVQDGIAQWRKDHVDKYLSK